MGSNCDMHCECSRVEMQVGLHVKWLLKLLGLNIAQPMKNYKCGSLKEF
jgi:hypothetical protein